MGDLVLLGAAGQQHQVDLLPGERDGDGYRNLLPGYHVLRVLRANGHWHGVDIVLPPDDGSIAVATYRLDGDARPIHVPNEPSPPRERLHDVLARDTASARAWQAATSALDARWLATPPTPSRPITLGALQGMFVYYALSRDQAATQRLRQYLAYLADPARLAADPAAAVELARAVGAMIALVPPLAAHLHADELVGALSDVGNARGEVDLIAAAGRLQLQISK